MGEDSKKLEAPEGFDGPVERKCTDVLFMLILIACWIAMTYLGVDALTKGDPALLINGVDYQGRICGVSEGVEDKPHYYFIQVDGTGVCVEYCPTTTDFTKLWGCTDDQQAFTAAAGFDCTSNPAQCTTLAQATPDENLTGTKLGDCMYQIESYDLLNYCIFTDPAVYQSFGLSDLSGNVSWIQEFMSDVYTARVWVMAFGFLFSMILGFAYCLMLRIPGVVCFLVWGSITAILALFIAIGYGFITLASEWEDKGTYEKYQINGAKGVGYLSFALTAVFFFLIIFMRKRIALANGVLKEACRVVGAIPAMIFMPVVQSTGLIVFLVPWLFYAVYTASMGEITADANDAFSFKSIEYSDEVVGRAWYFLFCWFWTSEFIEALGQIVIALVVVKYYFSRDKGSIGSGTFFTCVAQGMWYHLGTAAFGSLIIAIIEFIRSVIAYFQKKAKAVQNKIAEAVLCCCQCCFWCLEKCMKFVNKNAYIQTAIFSTSFCTSAKNAFLLIARNIVRVGAVSMVSEFIIIIMKLVICLATMGCTYLAMKQKIEDELYSLVGPTIFVGILAYFVASAFANLFNMSTLTILQCFIADEEMFAPSQRFADNELKEWLDENGGGSSKPQVVNATAVTGTGV